MAKEMKRLLYEGKIVISGSGLDYLFGKKKYFYSSVISRSIKTKKITEGVDYVYLNAKDYYEQYGMGSAGKGAYLLFESGVRKIAKEDNLELLDGYFTNNITSNNKTTNNKINKPEITNKAENIVEFKQEELCFDEQKSVTTNNEPALKIDNKSDLTTKMDSVIDIPVSMTNVLNKVSNNSTNSVVTENVATNNLLLTECINSVTSVMNSFIQMHKEMIQQQNDMHAQIRTEMKDLFLSLSTGLNVQNQTKTEINNVTPLKVVDNNVNESESEESNEEEFHFEELTKDDLAILNYNNEYFEWKKVINKAANLIVSLGGEYKNNNEVFRDCYIEIEADEKLNISIEMEKEAFFEKHKRTPVNNLQLFHFIESTRPEYKNILFAKLNTIYGRAKKNLAYAN